jgi:hypothetical protein
MDKKTEMEVELIVLSTRLDRMWKALPALLDEINRLKDAIEEQKLLLDAIDKEALLPDSGKVDGRDEGASPDIHVR